MGDTGDPSVFLQLFNLKEVMVVQKVFDILSFALLGAFKMF